MGKIESLHLVAAQLGDGSVVRLRLDAGDDGVDVEVLAEIGERPQDCDAVGALARVAHELLVDLDLIEGEALQMAERPKADTEIVKCNAGHPAVAAGERRVSTVAVAQEKPFGDLELEALGGKPRFRSARRVAAMRSPLSNCTEDRLTVTLISSGHCAASWQAAAAPIRP